MLTECDVLILGGGLTGLAAASGLGERAIVLEREARPGGLVRAECFNGYWFDHVIHLLYFGDPATEERIHGLLGDDLQPCVPQALVQFSDGTVQFPFQMHLGALPAEVVIECVTDFVEAAYATPDTAPKNYEELLLRSFGRKMCERFFFPYNRKMWRRPLTELAPAGFQWNIARPNLADVLRGALSKDTVAPAYNARGWYPRPPAGAAVRGMEVLSQRLATGAKDLRLGQQIKAIDLERRVVVTDHASGRTEYQWRDACLCSLPLPRAVSLCAQAPAALREACRKLVNNRVRSVAISIRGPRPTGTGHWRYYPDENLCFTRLVFMCEFDPRMAPPEGWNILAEIPEDGRVPPEPEQTLIARTCADVQRTGILPAGCEIVDARLMMADPAYVVFTNENEPIMNDARAFLRAHGIEPLGRYGRWEYSSMAQVLRDGFAWADRVAACAPEAPPAPRRVTGALA